MASLRSGTVALVAPGLLALGWGCKVYPESLLDPREQASAPAPIPGGGPGTGFWSGKNDDGCLSARFPSEAHRPPPSGGADLPPIYFANTKLWLGSRTLDDRSDKDAWRGYGFDLDGKCTLSPTCELDPPPVSCKAASPATPNDGDHCRDNTFGRLEYFITTIPEIARYGVDEDLINCALCQGRFNVLYRISGYNGQASDDSVRFDLFYSPGLEMPLGLTCTQPDTQNQLCFLVSAPWQIDRSTLENPGPPDPPGNSTIADPNAFVRDGYLVAQLPEKSLVRFEGTLTSGSGVFPLFLTHGKITGRLEKGEDRTWRLNDGILAGRILKEDVIKGFRMVGFCEGDKNYSVMTTYAQANVDISSSLEASPDTPCDAISVGIVFAAREASAGKLVDHPPLAECPPPPPGTAGAGGSM